ncbi:MAG: HPr family phosphocarrier protein [Clostridia bacterium]|nr:HPr family phosphocarrier protein [Clostridia bacterium]
MFKRNVKVMNKSGLHARPAAMFVQEASKFQSGVEIFSNAKKFNAKSIISILSSGIMCGTEIEICADGIDEVEAVNKLAELVESGFGEEKIF